jgi:beta-xylosidase
MTCFDLLMIGSMKTLTKLFFGIMFLHGGFNGNAQPGDSIYLFCYFKGNGDGLHLAYSEDAYQWHAMFDDSTLLKPAVSKDKLFRDPCIIRGRDGKFHMVWTVSWNDRGIGYSSSEDLMHWSDQQFIPVMANEESARNCWAPEITYDKKKQDYIIYWATTITGRFPSKDTAAESGYNHRMYYVRTKDFKKFSKTKLLYDPGFSVIDATIVPSGSEYLMFLKNETRAPLEKNIRVAHAKSVAGPWSAPGPAITGNYWAEGPTVLRSNRMWIVYFDKYREHQYGAVASSDLVHWKEMSSAVSFPAGMRHGTVFTVSRKEFENLNKGLR